MTRRRAHLSLKKKLAAALPTMERYRLAMIGRTADANDLYEHSKKMRAEQINSLFQFDHFPVRHADGGPDEPWNLAPIMIAAHRTKTAKHDAKAMAKDRRIDRKWQDFHRAVAEGPQATSTQEQMAEAVDTEEGLNGRHQSSISQPSISDIATGRAWERTK